MKQKQSFEIKQLRHRLYALIACEESQAECKAFRDLGWVDFFDKDDVMRGLPKPKF